MAGVSRSDPRFNCSKTHSTEAMEKSPSKPRTFKKLGRRHRHSGLSAIKSMELEKFALLRIAEICGSKRHHFPTLMTSDHQSIKITSVGVSLDPIKCEGVKMSLQLDQVLPQIGNIIDCLRVSKVRHLDVFPLLGLGACKNAALSPQDQTIALFYFYFSVIDDKPLSYQLKMRMEAT